MLAQLDTKPIFKKLSWGILIAGIVLRVVVFFQNRSLFIDEGAIASQIVSRSFGELFEPLQYQFSPPLFSTLVKISTILFGANEYALRLVPLLAGIGSLLIFYKLINKLFPSNVYLFVLGIFAFALPFIHYTTECKQYSLDVLITTLLLAVFFKYYQSGLQRKHFLLAAILGSTFVWSSMPVVFTLFGMGTYFIIQSIRSKQLGFAVGWMLVALSWLLSFIIYFLLILKKDSEISSLASYHQQYFFPLMPSNINELSQSTELLMSFLKTTLRATVLAQLLGLVLFFAGVINLWRNNKAILLPLLLPVASCILASSFGLYSLIPRMTLFAMPLVLIILAFGIEILLSRLPNYGIILLSLAMLIVFLNLNSFNYYYQPFQKDEIRPVLEYVHQKQQPDESVFVHHLGITAFQFYQNHHSNKSKFELQRVSENNWSDRLTQAVLNQSIPCWLILTHLNEEEKEEVLTAFQKKGKIADEFNAKNSSAILIK